MTFSPELAATLLSLLENLSLLLALTLIYTVARPWLLRVSKRRSAVVTGVIFGVFAIAATFQPVLLASGARFDGRSILIVISGAFGGPASVVVTGVVFLVFRLWAGATGILPSFSLIVLIGTLITVAVSVWFYRRVSHDQDYTPRQLALLGLYLAFQSLILSAINTPAKAGDTIRSIGVPLIVAYPLATALIGTLLVNEFRRTRLENALRESEQRFRQITTSINQSFSLRDADTGRILYMSPAFETIWGLPVQVALDSVDTVLETIHPDDRARFTAERLETSRENGHVFQYRIVRPDGEIRHIRSMSFPVVEADGIVRRAAGIAEDVTERKRSEEQLRESQHFVERIAGTIPDRVFVFDFSLGNNVYANRDVGLGLGYTPEEIQATGSNAALPFFHPDDLARLPAFEEQQKQLRDGEALEFEYRMKHANGEWRWFINRVSPFQRGADGTVQQVIGIARDITERKNSEEQLRESQHFVERIASTVPDMFYVYDMVELKTVYSNREIGVMLDYPPGVFPTLNLSSAQQHIHPDDVASMPVIRDQRLALADRDNIEYEYRMRHAGGDWRWLHSRETVFQRGADGAVTQVIGIARDITERKRSEEALRQSQHFVERIASTVPNRIFVYDFSQQLNVYSNRDICIDLGYTPEQAEAIGSNLSLALFHPDDLAHLPDFQEQQKQMRDGDVLEFEYRLKDAGGEWRWFINRVSPFQRAADDTLQQVIGIARDITERKQYEEQLRESQHFIERIATTVPDLLYVYDLSLYDKIFENRTLGSALGYTPEQIAAPGPRIIGRLLHPDDYALVESAGYQAKQKNLADGEVLETEYRLKNASGEWRWLYSRDTVFQRADDGSVLQLIGVARDVTERKQIEEALRQSQHFVERVTTTVPDLLYVFTLSNFVKIFENHTLGEALGYTPEENAAMGSRLVTMLMHPDDRARIAVDDYRARQTGLADGEVLETEFRIKHANGEWRWIISRDTPFSRDEEGNIAQMIGVARDITDRKRSDEKLQRYAEALERNNEELEMFAYTASHDLQEPLRKIQAFGDRLQIVNADGLSDQGRDYLMRMMNAASRMQSLIQDLLAYSRVGRGTQPFSQVDLTEVAAAVCTDLEVAITKAGAQVDMSRLYTVDADPTQMRQLLQNLIGNALKFRAPDRDPVVTVSGRLVDGPSDAADPDAPFYELTVSDNGIGFEEKFNDRIFGMFQRLHGRTEYEGTGIGLAICRKIAERHHGTIQAIGRVGQGATFVVTIPVRQPIEDEVVT